MNKDFIDKLAPFEWFEYYSDDATQEGKNPSISLMLEAGYKEEIFITRVDDGFEAGGYGWAALAEVFLNEKMPELKKDIRFDPEGSMFCVYSNNIEAITKFALGLRKMFDNDELMEDLLSRASDEWL